ncbi:MAG TPA: hypothetical protein VKB27_04780 [Gammaproteobacteria bacterium]|nr:hypothetical protein [Gammaproteobacteria bacterium]
MIRTHLRRHGQSYGRHFINNWLLTRIAIKSAMYTFGHGILPLISGRRASQLHNELWNRGRALSLEDLNHRLYGGYYADKAAALEDYRDYAGLYSETSVIEPFLETLERYYADRCR